MLFAAFAALAVTATAQDTPNPNDKTKLDRYRGGNMDPGEAAERKVLFEKYAKFYAARLSHNDTQRPGAEQGFSWLVNDLDKRLIVPSRSDPSPNLYYGSKRLSDSQRQYIDEFGKSVIEAIDGPATRGEPFVVRVNAARMAAEVARSGYDGAAELCVKIIAKPDENDGVRYFALQGLRNLFAIIPDEAVPVKTVFQKDNTGNLSPLERKSIKTLIDYVFRQPSAELKPEEVDALYYVRREAVRALALVRVQRVKTTNGIESQPALALLKIARGDGLNPPSAHAQGPDMRALGERLEAIIGFCNLIPPTSDRDMNLDYAVYHVGRAIQEIAPLFKANDRDTSMAWKSTALRLQEAMTYWKTRSGPAEMNLVNNKLIQELYDLVDRDVMQAIIGGQQTNAAALNQWLTTTPPKSKSLFANDPKSTVDAR
jgi:hypothetical protein